MRDKITLIWMTIRYSVAIRNKEKRASMYRSQECEMVSVVFNDRRFDITLRMQDLSMIYEVWMEQNYKLHSGVNSPQVILDIGAHIGMTSLYYWSMFGDSVHYFCLEGSDNNYQLLIKNTQHISKISCINAVVTCDGRDVLFNQSLPGHLQKIHLEKGITHISKTIDEIIRPHDISSIDICKVDIEGAEKEIIQSHPHTLQMVKQLYIELHKGYEIGELDKDLSYYKLSRTSKTLRGILHYKKS